MTARAAVAADLMDVCERHRAVDPDSSGPNSNRSKPRHHGSFLLAASMSIVLFAPLLLLVALTCSPDYQPALLLPVGISSDRNAALAATNATAASEVSNHSSSSSSSSSSAAESDGLTSGRDQGEEKSSAQDLFRTPA